VTGSTTESATFSRIGYWSIGMKMMFWFLLWPEQEHTVIYLESNFTQFLETELYH
jgi:hypothetical protein